MSVPSTALSSGGRGSGAWTGHTRLSRDAIYSMMETPIGKLRGAVRGRPGPHMVAGLLGSRNRAANFKTSQLNAGNFTAVGQQNANYNYAAKSVKGQCEFTGGGSRTTPKLARSTRGTGFTDTLAAGVLS